MNQEKTFQLDTSSILKVPLENYGEEFTFIVNGKEFKTSSLFADLVSPRVSEMHRTDPTMNSITINTNEKGDFSHILDLLSFNEIKISLNDLNFFKEIISKLGTTTIKMTNKGEEPEITEENVIEKLCEHYFLKDFYCDDFTKEIDFISSHFFKLFETHTKEMKNLDPELIYLIISNEKLRLKDENQLLKFVNDIYCERGISNLYEFVLFSNVDVKLIEEFIDIYDYNSIDYGTWKSITKRLRAPVSLSDTKLNSRYEKENENSTSKQKQNQTTRGQLFNGSNFDGIINYLRSQSNGNIENKINITTSSLHSRYPPSNVVIYNDDKKLFRIYSGGLNNWLCIEFKENKIIPTSYQIKSIPSGSDSNHLKSWIVEGSNDNSKWEKIDEQNNNSCLNGNCNTHIFTIENSKSTEFRFIRIRNTGPDWASNNYLMLGSIEFYGKLI